MNAEEPITADPSCLDEYDPNALSTAAALERIAAGLQAIPGVEHVALRPALGRIAAHDVRSAVAVPAHDNSAMDGYALRGTDIDAARAAGLSVVGTALAGRPCARAVYPGECVRIMTGAIIPEGADTVVAQERVQRTGDRIRIEGDLQVRDNVRDAGEDIRPGQVVLEAGRRLLPADLGLLASLGIAEVPVRRRLRVAFFSTGDELRGLGEQLGPGDLYDSNRYTLYGMLAALGADLIDLGVVRDDPDALRGVFAEAGAIADVVISSGGVSVGEADFVKDMLAELGQVDFWKIAMKPGRPLAFGRLGNAIFFGLPGNPVSVMVTFYVFVQPALRRLMGERWSPPPMLRATCTGTLRKKTGRMEFQRAILERSADGTLTVRRTGAQGSGILTSMSGANCFVVLPVECGDVAPGTMVDVIAFHGLLP
ncbi:MAG: gephyrin-like molybdotransferase Glp [Gammaproteobacteria bacterium]